MRQSVKGISAAAIIFFTVTVQSARADFGCRDEKSRTVCQPEDLVQNGPKGRIKQSRILFETNNCLVRYPRRDSPIGPQQFMRTKSHVVVRYECQIPQTTGPQSDLGKKQRTTESVNAKYDLACALSV